MDKAIADKDVNQACALSYVRARTPARVIVRAQTRRNRNISRLCAQVGAPTMPQMCVPPPPINDDETAPVLIADAPELRSL